MHRERPPCELSARAERTPWPLLVVRNDSAAGRPGGTRDYIQCTGMILSMGNIHNGFFYYIDVFALRSDARTSQSRRCHSKLRGNYRSVLPKSIRICTSTWQHWLTVYSSDSCVSTMPPTARNMPPMVFTALPRQQAPTGQLSLDNLMLQRVQHHGDFMVARLEPPEATEAAQGLSSGSAGEAA